MANPAIDAALEIARRRHGSIAEGDFEAYCADDAAIAATCAELVGAGASSLTAADIPLLDELVGLETQSRRLLDGLMAEASGRMDTLRQTGRTNAAYLRHERFSVNGA